MLGELTPLLIGADPFRIEHLWHLAYRARPFRGNLLSAAVSAIDLALWDIKGKALGVPVWELLGGRTRDRVRLHVLVGGGTPDEIVSSVNWAVEEGFTAVKFDPLVTGYEDLSVAQLVSSACAMAAAAREAGGDEIDLIFELHRKLDPAKAIVVCNALARVPPAVHRGSDPDRLDRDPGRHRRSASPRRSRLGERLSSIWEFSELLSHNVPIVVRPDVGLAGGLSGCRKIAAIAEAHHCGVAPHNFLGPGLTAPTLQLCATIPNLVTMEYLPRDEEPRRPAAAFDTAWCARRLLRGARGARPRRRPRRRLRGDRPGHRRPLLRPRGFSGRMARSPRRTGRMARSRQLTELHPATEGHGRRRRADEPRAE